MANTFKNYAVKDVGTSTATILTATATTIIIGVSIANTSGSTINVDVWITIGGVDYFVVENAPIPPGGALVPIGNGYKHVLESGDALKCNSDAAASADALASVLEIT